MKIRESGMPDAEVWESFFDPDKILTRLRLSSDCRNVVEFGCGYGTFTLPTARRITGTVFAIDIESSSIDGVQDRAAVQGLTNIAFAHRDFLAAGTGLPDASVDYALLFNILHCPEPVALLREAYRNLTGGGFVGILHWVHDPETPRGPPLSIRPRPEQCREWALEAGFTGGDETINLPPYHYGLALQRPYATHD
jgi:SAM-dependent methyltransferase